MENTTKIVDVVVIGAGASGLAAAYRLASNHSISNLVVLEANERIGGRLLSVDVPTADGSDRWDMGGQWVSSSQHKIMTLLKEFNVGVYPQYMTGKNKIALNGLKDIRSYSGLIPKFGVLELLDMDKMMKKVTAMANQIVLGDPLSCEKAREWDQETVYSFLQRNCCFEATLQVLSVAVKTVFGCETSQLSLFFMLYYSALSGGFETLLETYEGAAQEFRVKGTVYSFMKKLEKAIGADKVLCGDPVVSIDQSSGSYVLVKTEKNCVYRANHVICAVPPHLLDRMRFEPSLPFYRRQLCQRMPIGNLIKCLVVYRKAFWRDENFSGQAVILSEPFTTGCLCVTFDATTSNGSPALLSFIAGEHATYWSQKSKKEREEEVLNSFIALYGSQAREQFVAYEEKDWSKEDYIGGCPAGLMQPGCLVYFEHTLRQRFGRIHWAGTETAQRWMGYIDGAVEAGERAADEIAECLASNQASLPSDVDLPSRIFTKEKISSGCSFGKLLLFGAVVGVAGVAGYCLYKKSNNAAGF